MDSRTRSGQKWQPLKTGAFRRAGWTQAQLDGYLRLERGTAAPPWTAEGRAYQRKRVPPPTPPLHVEAPVAPPPIEPPASSPPKPELPPTPAIVGGSPAELRLSLTTTDLSWSSDEACITRSGWCVDVPVATASQRGAGSYSHIGPEWVRQEKGEHGNEDFACHLCLPDANGAEWVLCAVADGVSQSAWVERGARIAIASFIGCAETVLRDPALLEVLDAALTESSPAGFELFAKELSTRFHTRVLEALRADMDYLVAGGFSHPSWDPAVYARQFLSSPDAAANREQWFQTTLLATVLGPRGGFALFLGDGAGLVRRKREGTWSVKAVPMQGADGRPEVPVFLGLKAEDVARYMRRLALQSGDEAIGVVLATDGVSKSPRNELEHFECGGSQQCREYLEQLASRPMGEVESDNMTLAFAWQVCA